MTIRRPSRERPSIRPFSVTIALLLAAGAVNADPGPGGHHRTGRTDHPEQTLVSGDVEHGGFGGPVVKVSDVDGDAVLFAGGRGGWIINHTLVIGGGGYGMVTEVRADGPRGRERLDFGYGGFEVEYLVQSDLLVHGSILALVGAGGLSYAYDTRDGDAQHARHDEQDAVFVTELLAQVELNVTTWFRLALGGGYRLVRDVDLVGVDDGALSAPVGSLSAKFGRF